MQQNIKNKNKKSFFDPNDTGVIEITFENEKRINNVKNIKNYIWQYIFNNFSLSEDFNKNLDIDKSNILNELEKNFSIKLEEKFSIKLNGSFKVKIKISKKDVYPHVYLIYSYDGKESKINIKVDNLIKEGKSTIDVNKWKSMKVDIVNDIQQDYINIIKQIKLDIEKYNNSFLKSAKVLKEIKANVDKFLNRKISYKNKKTNDKYPSFYLFGGVELDIHGKLVLIQKICPKVEKINNGSFGRVLMLENYDLEIRDDDQIIIGEKSKGKLALKVQSINKGGFGQKIDYKDHRLESIKKEIAGTKKLDVQNVYSIYNTEPHNNIENNAGEKIYFSLDYYKYGMVMQEENLFLKHTGNRYGKISEEASEKRMKILQIIAKQVREIHKKGFIHRDIKGENILMNIEKNQKKIEYKDILVSDLGFLLPIGQDGNVNIISKEGTQIFMAPECSPTVNGQNSINTKVDVYSLGQTFLQLICESNNCSNKNILENINKEDLLDERSYISRVIEDAVPGYGMNLRSVIYNMLEKDSKKRYSMEQVIGELGKKNEEYLKNNTGNINNDIQIKKDIYEKLLYKTNPILEKKKEEVKKIYNNIKVNLNNTNLNLSILKKINNDNDIELKSKKIDELKGGVLRLFWSEKKDKLWEVGKLEKEKEEIVQLQEKNKEEIVQLQKEKNSKSNNAILGLCGVILCNVASVVSVILLVSNPLGIGLAALGFVISLVSYYIYSIKNYNKINNISNIQKFKSIKSMHYDEIDEKLKVAKDAVVEIDKKTSNKEALYEQLSMCCKEIEELYGDKIFSQDIDLYNLIHVFNCSNFDKDLNKLDKSKLNEKDLAQLEWSLDKEIVSFDSKKINLEEKLREVEALNNAFLKMKDLIKKLEIVPGGHDAGVQCYSSKNCNFCAREYFSNLIK